MISTSQHASTVRYAKGKGWRVEPDGTLIGIRGIPLKPHCDTRGYYRVTLTAPKLDGTITRSGYFFVHVLQAYQKYGEAIFDDNIQVRHLDGNSRNNAWDNIAIGTQSINMLDRPKATRVRIAKIAAAKRRRFTDEQIKEMRDLKASGKTLSFIGELFGIGKGHVSDIVNNKLYA